MKLLLAHLSKNRRIITKIKNDFDNTFWNDMFILKGSDGPRPARRSGSAFLRCGDCGM